MPEQFFSLLPYQFVVNCKYDIVLSDGRALGSFASANHGEIESVGDNFDRLGDEVVLPELVIRGQSLLCSVQIQCSSFKLTCASSSLLLSTMVGI